jgi:GNAT superfamily N-acetyltransferase
MLDIGSYRDGDRDAVAGFVVAMFDDEQEPRQLVAADFAVGYADAMFRTVAERDGVILVARMAEQPIGFGCVVPADDLDPTLRQEARARATVDYLFVARPWRRTGVGRRLLAALEHAMRERGHTCIRLRVKATNLGARQLYEVAGYLPQELILSKRV